MKKLLLAILLLLTASYSYAQLTSYQSTPLPSAQQGTTLLSTIGGSSGSENSVYHNTWLVRNVTGNNWYSTRVHDGISVDNSFLNPQINTLTWWERDPNANIQSWGTNGSTYLTINNGNIGIGITNPQTNLSVKGYTLPTNQWSGYASSLQVGELMIQDYGTTPQVGFEQNTYFDGASNKYILNGYASALYMGANGNITFSVYNNGVSGNTVSGTGLAMTIANSGYVGIGTTQPDQKLTVNGTIHATEVLVDQTVKTPDYVFDKGYDLISLKDIKFYIDQNHHLPEIPSAAQVAKEGINLGEMNAKLLKKIEELTLYLIEKDLQMSTEQSKNTTQQQQIDQQQKQIDQLNIQLKSLRSTLNKK